MAKLYFFIKSVYSLAKFQKTSNFEVEEFAEFREMTQI